MSKRGLTALVLSLAMIPPACARKEAAAAAPRLLRRRLGPAAPSAAPITALVSDKALVDGHLVLVTHSRWDGGQTSDMFDTNPA